MVIANIYDYLLPLPFPCFLWPSIFTSAGHDSLPGELTLTFSPGASEPSVVLLGLIFIVFCGLHSQDMIGLRDVLEDLLFSKQTPCFSHYILASSSFPFRLRSINPQQYSQPLFSLLIQCHDELTGAKGLVSTFGTIDSLLCPLGISLIQWQNVMTSIEAEHWSHILLLAYINNKVHTLISVRFLYPLG